MSSLEAALAAIDALHAADPETIEVDGIAVARELDYARRMSAALERVIDAPSDALRIAARAQHLQRWRLARGAFAAKRAGYHAWRTAQSKAHAALAVETLRPLGFTEDALARIAALVEKRRRTSDAEAQALEDAACLVFLETHLLAFAEDRDPEQVLDVLRKTWAKMGPRGREAALALELPEEARALVARALS